MTEQTIRAMARAAEPSVDRFIEPHVTAMTQAGMTARLVAPTRRRAARRRGLMRLDTARRASVVGVAMLVSTAGAAYAGVLPAPAQNAIADTVKVVGISLPHASARDTDHGNGANGATLSAAVTQLAHDATLAGRQKGAAISAAASEHGKATAGAHHDTSRSADRPKYPHAPTHTPSSASHGKAVSHRPKTHSNGHKATPAKPANSGHDATHTKPAPPSVSTPSTPSHGGGNGNGKGGR